MSKVSKYNKGIGKNKRLAMVQKKKETRNKKSRGIRVLGAFWTIPVREFAQGGSLVFGNQK